MLRGVVCSYGGGDSGGVAGEEVLLGAEVDDLRVVHVSRAGRKIAVVDVYMVYIPEEETPYRR